MTLLFKFLYMIPIIEKEKLTNEEIMTLEFLNYRENKDHRRYFYGYPIDETFSCRIYEYETRKKSEYKYKDQSSYDKLENIMAILQRKIALAVRSSDKRYSYPDIHIKDVGSSISLQIFLSQKDLAGKETLDVLTTELLWSKNTDLCKQVFFVNTMLDFLNKI